MHQQLSNRVPNIAKPPVFDLDNGTTAKKAHEKDPLKVENGDEVTYTITVYNEADVAGTNVTVTDYLPNGLQYVSGSKTWGQQEQQSCDYTPYTLNYGTIDAASANSLKAVSNTITCKVTATEGSNRVDLKNITEITSATGGTDRDSNPGNLTPSDTYNPSTAEQGMGEQDDDDYEHLYLEPNKEFDLAIRKYITEIKDKDGNVKYSMHQHYQIEPKYCKTTSI